MELAAGKKENDSSNNTQATPASDEDRERVALDLKAGLHPLKVRPLLPFLSGCSLFVIFFVIPMFVMWMSILHVSAYRVLFKH